MAEKCPYCNNEFANTKALGSHIHYNHSGGGVAGTGSLIRTVDQAQELIAKVDRLIEIWEKSMAIPGAAPTDLAQLIRLLQEEVPETIGPSAIVPFKKTVATAYQDEQDRNIAFSGKVADVIISFPAGPHQLVDVRLIYLPKNGGQVCLVPSLDDAFIALDDFTAIFHPNSLIVPPGLLRVEWWNYDSLNPHSIPVIVTLTRTNIGVEGVFA